NLHFTVGTDARIQSGGGVTATGEGYPGGQGPGAGRSSITQQSLFSGGGGGYGGDGGNGFSNAVGGLANGSLRQALQPGSGGGSQTPRLNNAGGSGGGIVSMSVSGTLTLEGAITSDGTPGV